MSTLKTGRTSSGTHLESLLEQSGRGDEVAFAALYDATAARAYGLSLSVLHDRTEATEAVREAYLHLWTHAARFEPTGGSAISWVMTVVRQRALGRMRPAASPGAARPGASATSLTRRALANLPPTQRQSLELACYRGYTHTEVDLMSGLPVGTARLQIRDGLVGLRDTWGEPSLPL
jgi:RNA polymerase sigma-70 factor (ECF subfamily)